MDKMDWFMLTPEEKREEELVRHEAQKSKRRAKRSKDYADELRLERVVRRLRSERTD